jgi:DNA (cytosine-5)-methyltransferase 1
MRVRTFSPAPLSAIKPLYRVPSMTEIAAFPDNGFNVVSTFSGCGGSCLGYRMAGFKVLWANEFIPSAQETYRANHPDSILDTRDIRIVQPKEILKAVGLMAGEIDILDGSPPCASFSLAGKRERDWGKVKDYSETRQRTDDLFFEYARLLKGLQPKVFIAENVGGLVRGTAKGYFLDILRCLKDCGYIVKSRLLDAQWLGVPQMRQRIIFIGVRLDLGREPVFPNPLPYRYTVRDALPHILRHGTAPTNDQFLKSDRNIGSTLVESADHACPTIVAGHNKGVGHVEAERIAVRVLHDTSGDRSQGDITDRPCPAITVGAGSMNACHYQIEEADISRFAIGKEWDMLGPGEASTKYFNLVKPDTEKPCPTVTAIQGVGTASVVHPTEKRKFTIAELKRICAFPDDFILTGSYGQQWERLGRAVPPVMMYHIASTVRDQILEKLK